MPPKDNPLLHPVRIYLCKTDGSNPIELKGTNEAIELVTPEPAIWRPTIRGTWTFRIKGDFQVLYSQLGVRNRLHRRLRYKTNRAQCAKRNR